MATYSGVADDKGNLFSYCVWSKGVVALLPQTDKIWFVEEGGEPHLAAWERVVDVCDHRMKAQGWYPERWFVEDYPTPEELQKMGAVPLEPTP